MHGEAKNEAVATAIVKHMTLAILISIGELACW